MTKFILPLSILLILGVSCNTHKQTENNEYRIPGSYKALELFSHLRSYPYPDIPNDAYSRGFEFHEKYVEKTSVLKNVGEWEPAGPKNTAGRTLTIEVNPQNNNTIYAGSASGGLWRSYNLGMGESWEYVDTGFPVLGVSTIAFAPGDSTVMYIGTGEVYNYSDTGTDAAYRSTRGSYGVGILKSEDGGKSWTKSLNWSYNQQHGVWMVKVAPTDPNIVYAATTEGVFKSIDAGNSWIEVLDVIMCTDIEIYPDNPDVVVVSAGNFGTEGKGIYHTQDGGENWKEATGAIPDDFQGKILLARAPSNNHVMYASIGNGFWFNDGFTWLLKSIDGGKRWAEVNTVDYSRWQGWFSHDIAVDPRDENTIVCVGIDIFKSTDGGQTLLKKSTGGVAFGTPPVDGPDGPPNYSHSDHHFVGYHPGIPDLVLFGNDGGVFLSFDGAESFMSANGNMQTTQFYNGFSVSHLNPEFAMGGLQDNSTVLYRGDGAWQRAIGGDGSWTGINQQNDNIVYGSYQNLNINRSSNNGLGFFPVSIPYGNGENPLFISPYIVSESHPDIIYAAGIYMYKSLDKGQSWEIMNRNAPINTDPVFSLDVSSQNPDVIYAGTVGQNHDPSIYISLNGGDSFYDATNRLPDRIPNDIKIDPNDDGTAYVCFSGFGTNHLYKTTDFGFNWDPIDQDLPDVPGNAIAIDPADSNILYYGNDIGVYVSEDGGLSWTAWDSGVPMAMIAMDLTISPKDRKIWVATHGNGTYRADMIESSVSTDENIENNRRIRVYPNPVSHELTIESEKSSAHMNWILYDLAGKKVLSGSSNSMIVDGLESGIYLLEFLQEKERSVHRIIVK